jgi:hypothetical protein
MLRYHGFGILKYGQTHECLAYESLRHVKYPGRGAETIYVLNFSPRLLYGINLVVSSAEKASNQ